MAAKKEQLFGLRKFTIAILFWLSGTVLCATQTLSGGNFVLITGIVTGLYGITNVGEHVSAKIAGALQKMDE